MATIALKPQLLPRFRYVLLGGLAAGAFDLTYICSLWSFRGASPVRILQAIAAGWLGHDQAVAGGYASALLGLVSHFSITVAMAFAYGVVALRIPALIHHPYRYGTLYGLLLYALMTYVVVPLSAAGTGHAPAWQWINLAHIAAHMLLVGLPCAWAARYAAMQCRTGRFIESTFR